MRSMTGQGLGHAGLDGATLSVELRSVNHRYLDIRVRAPAELLEHAFVAEAVVRAQLVRGRVDVSIRIEADGDAGPQRLDMDRARAAFRALRELRDELAPDEPLPLSLLASVPDLFRSGGVADAETFRAALEAATRQACRALWEMRAQEGQALREELLRLRDAAEQETRHLAQGVPAMVEGYRHKLQERLSTLLAGRELPLDPGRLEHEVAVFADRADVTEELARLQSHLGQLDQTIDAEEGSVGRRLDFLLQEMAREANTIGSKVAAADLTLHVVELKAVLERIREQVQNVL